MGKGGGGGQAKNASWRNLDSTLQEMSNQPLQEAAQSMSVGNWASDLLTGGAVTSQSVGPGKDAWSGYWFSDPTQGYAMGGQQPTWGNVLSAEQGVQTTGGAQGGGSTLQFNPSGAWATQAGPVLGGAYLEDIYNVNQANSLEGTFYGRGTQDYAQIEQDRQMTLALQGLLGQDVNQMTTQQGNIDYSRALANQQLGNVDEARGLANQDINYINAARQATQGLETGTGLYSTQQAYVDQAVASGQAAVQQKLASMGIGESTQNAMLQNQVAQSGAATAGQLVQGNIQLSEAQQQLEQQLYGTDVTRLQTEAGLYGTGIQRMQTEAGIYGTDVQRYGTDVSRQQADIAQQNADFNTYNLDTNLGLSQQQLSQQAVSGLLNIQTSLQNVYSGANQAASQFFNNALAPYGYILSDLATRSGINVSNAQIAEQAQAAQSQGMGSLLQGVGSLFGSGGLGSLLGGAGGAAGAGLASIGGGASVGGSVGAGLGVAALALA